MQPIHRFQPSGVRSHIAPSHQPESHLQSEFGGSHDDGSIDGESDGDGSSMVRVMDFPVMKVLCVLYAQRNSAHKQSAPLQRVMV